LPCASFLVAAGLLGFVWIVGVLSNRFQAWTYQESLRVVKRKKIIKKWSKVGGVIKVRNALGGSFSPVNVHSAVTDTTPLIQS